jgi:hypothetical protein
MRTRILAILFLSFGMASLQALAQQTNVDWDHHVTDFSKYRTYTWVKPVRPTSNPLMDERIVAAIDSQLQAKGLRKVDSNGDMLVTYSAGVRKETSAIATGGGGWRWGGGMGRIDPVIDNVGTLVVDLSDAEQKKLVWRGAASGTLSDKADKNTNKIDKAVQKLFKQYPPKSKK